MDSIANTCIFEGKRNKKKSANLDVHRRKNRIGQEGKSASVLTIRSLNKYKKYSLQNV